MGSRGEKEPYCHRNTTMSSVAFPSSIRYVINTKITNFQDVAMHGKSYAKYKADMLKEFQGQHIFMI